MKRLGELRNESGAWRKLTNQLDDLEVMAELAEEDAELAAEFAQESACLKAEVDQYELDSTLSGPYDSSDAILVVHSGEGGIDAQDWAEMLSRMYVRWAERRGLKAEVLDTTEGEEAGVKNATIEIRGSRAYGYAKAEAGSHRLVRMSPFDAAHRRMVDHGVEFAEEPRDEPYGRVAVFVDVAGNRWDLLGPASS